jgi:hypothetical protein
LMYRMAVVLPLTERAYFFGLNQMACDGYPSPSYLFWC